MLRDITTLKQKLGLTTRRGSNCEAITEARSGVTCRLKENYVDDKSAGKPRIFISKTQYQKAALQKQGITEDATVEAETKKYFDRFLLMGEREQTMYELFEWARIFMVEK